MARDFSADYEKQLGFSHLPSLHLRLRARPLIKTYRRLRHRIAPGQAAALSEDFATDLVSPRLEEGQDHLRAERWAFFDGILNEPFHSELLAGWPKRHFLDPASDLRKSWDRGFAWRRGHGGEPADLDRHPALARYFAYLRSEEFGRRFSAVVDEEVTCYSFLVTSSVTGSVVAPHRDDWAFLESGPKAVFNFVLFVDGTGGPGSGGLSILNTNTFDEVIFESLKLRNTALIYDVKAPFYHGFEPIRQGKFRHAIIANFVSPDHGS